MQSEEIRKKFLSFFEKRGHKIVPSASLVPENDPSVLFTTAGMQQFKSYYTDAINAQKDFNSLNTASIQKVVRTSDIEEVGDESHLTFFEMLGNFSFGGYFKEKAIEYGWDFIKNEMGLKIDYVTVFGGEGDIPPDDESKEVWTKLDPSIEVRKAGKADNFWGPTGDEGPCGPTTEIYVNRVEIWNIVFNEYYQGQDKTLTKLDTPGVDTGMGLERLTMVKQKVPTIFETDLFFRLLAVLPDYLGDRKKKILVDHSRAVCFMINDGVRPENKGRGSVLRRLLRRILSQFTHEEIKLAIDFFTNKYPELNREVVWNVLDTERSEFIVALNLGMKELEKMPQITAKDAFSLYSTYGLPIDVIKDKFPDLNMLEIEREFSRHKEVSKVGSERMFKGGLANTKEQTVKLHTAHHLLLAALQEVLGKEVKQRGSNITEERLRIDFSFERKLTPEEISKVEEKVNSWIKSSLNVVRQEMPKEEAQKLGAEMEFGAKYPNVVSVYFIGPTTPSHDAVSIEFCGGPHVKNTKELGRFKIFKEEAVSTGTRRIKATLE